MIIMYTFHLANIESFGFRAVLQIHVISVDLLLRRYKNYIKFGFLEKLFIVQYMTSIIQGVS